MTQTFTICVGGACQSAGSRENQVPETYHLTREPQLFLQLAPCRLESSVAPRRAERAEELPRTLERERLRLQRCTPKSCQLIIHA